MAKKITPTCRYGHGEMVRLDDEGKKQHYSVDTYPHKSVSNKPGAYLVFSFVIYKCPECSYLEFHDE